MAKKVNKIDGWSNVLTGLNLLNRDKKMSMVATYSRMTQVDAESIYAVDPLARKIVDKPVTEAFRKDIVFKHESSSEDFDGEVHSFLKNYDFISKYIKAAKWARLYGSAYLLFGIRDGRFPHEPVDEDRIISIDWVQPLHRWELGYSQIERDVSKPFYREPVLYTLNEAGVSGADTVGFTVHRSRLIRLDGSILPDELYKLNGYSHDSVLNALQGSLRNFTSAHDSTASLLEDFAQGVFKINNLGQLIASGKDDQVLKRLQLIDTTRSVVKGIVLDSEEDFRREVTSLSGLSDIIQRVGDKLVADSDMPHTLLLGEGSTGNLSGAGESEQTQWYDRIKDDQNNIYKPPFMKGVTLLMKAKNSPFKSIPNQFDSEFPALEELNDKEQSEVNLKQAQADNLYITNQTLDPAEVAISRFGSGKLNLKTIIDVSEREALLDIGGTPDPEPKDPNAVPKPPENDPKIDEVEHFHSIAGVLSGPAVMADDGGHYHEYTIDGEIFKTDSSLNNALHMHKLNNRMTSYALELKDDEEKKGYTSKELKKEDFANIAPFESRQKAKALLARKEDAKLSKTDWVRVEKIAKGDTLPMGTITKMAKYDRHKKTARADQWDSWGGTEGIEWAKGIISG